MRASGWKGRVIPCFRPDAVVNIDENWRENIRGLAQAAGIAIKSCHDFIAALENRRAFFKKTGATATDHAVVAPSTHELSQREADNIFNEH